MKSYAPIMSLVTTSDGACPDGYIEVESPIVNGGLQAIVRDLRAREATWAMRHERETKLTDMANERIRQLESAVHQAYNQFENITVADTLEIAKDRAHSFIGWAVANLPGYENDAAADGEKR